MNEENLYSAKIKQMTDYYEELAKGNTELKEIGFHEMVPLLSESFFTGETGIDKLDDFLESIDSDTIKNRIKSKLIQLKKQIQDQKAASIKKVEVPGNVQKEPIKQNKEKGKIFQRLQTGQKAQPPKKRAKVQREVMKDEKKQKQQPAEGGIDQLLARKEGLKRQLEKQGKQKCRFFPFCKNEQTCEYFHPTQKVSKNYTLYKRVNKIYT